jgi:hypothetical protein
MVKRSCFRCRENIDLRKSDSGYLGAEPAKAETALRLKLNYEQDQPLRLNQLQI